jgi:hypothetical protein
MADLYSNYNIGGYLSMSRFQIADILIEIKPDDTYLLERFNLFRSISDNNPDLVVCVKDSEYISKLIGKPVLNEGIKWVRSYEDDNKISVYIDNENNHEIIYKLESDDTWRNVTITFLKSITDGEYVITGPLGEILFRTHILFHQGIVMHSSAIKCNGKGIMFSAPSETGKSTQANLWKTFMGADILNGDRPTVRIVNDKPYVYGTPWSGSSSEYLNDCAPLNAIVMLEQASVNTIERLEGSEALAHIFPRCFLPYYDKRLMDLAIGNIENIINKVPVYLLKCRPDRDAVELVYECLK